MRARSLRSTRCTTRCRRRRVVRARQPRRSSTQRSWRKPTSLPSTLSAVEVLAQRGMAQPLAFFRDCVQQHQKARTLLRQLAQSLTRQGAKREQWAHLRADLLVVCEAVPFVHEKFCLELFCGALLLAREYKLAQENLAQLEGGEALCLTTARELVNGSTTLSDESLREARKVLQLVRPTPALQQELALIDACERLSTLRLPQAVMPPIQVRLTPQPLTLVDAVLQHNELLYIDAAAVLALARGIGASSDADVFAVRCLLGNAGAARQRRRDCAHARASAARRRLQDARRGARVHRHGAWNAVAQRSGVARAHAGRAAARQRATSSHR
jgi:hypothetical protein